MTPDDFADSLSAWGDETKAALQERTLAIAERIRDQAAAATPVKTGRARASWVLGFLGELIAEAQRRNEETTRRLRALERPVELELVASGRAGKLVARDGSRGFVIQNMTPYVGTLESGTQRGSGHHMLDLAITDAAAQ